MVGTLQSKETVLEASVVDAVDPSDRDQNFLKIMVRETQEYAFSNGYTDFIFQGTPKNRYFGGYKTSRKTRGKGLFIFGFALVAKKLEFYFPAHVPEPRQLSQPWKGKTKPARRTIPIPSESTLEFFAYLTELAKNSIESVYNSTDAITPKQNQKQRV